MHKQNVGNCISSIHLTWQIYDFHEKQNICWDFFYVVTLLSNILSTSWCTAKVMGFPSEPFFGSLKHVGISESLLIKTAVIKWQINKNECWGVVFLIKVN